MHLLELPDQGFGSLRCPGTALNDGHDFLVKTNCTRAQLDVLVFLDSRGVSAQYPGSLVERIVQDLEQRRNYLVVCRPLELTTWATLVNFLTVNELHPAQLITNLGFVDFTPKKQSILEDAQRQIEAHMGTGLAHSQFVEHYSAVSGEVLELFSMTYTAAFRDRLDDALPRGATVLIDTPLVKPDIKVPRKRPRSFFEGLAAAQTFNRSLHSVELIELPWFDASETYDAVHYTDTGNELIFERLRPCL